MAQWNVLKFLSITYNLAKKIDNAIFKFNKNQGPAGKFIRRNQKISFLFIYESILREIKLGLVATFFPQFSKVSMLFAKSRFFKETLFGA